MDWSTYYNMMSMNNWNYPMMNYSMAGYQNPYQNLNMSLWNYQNPYYMPGSNTAGQTNPAFKGNTNTEDKEKPVKEAPVKAEPKDYVSISKDGTLYNSEIYTGASDKIAEYKKEYKRKNRNSLIGALATVIGSIALGLVAGPKIAKALKLKPDTLLGAMASDDKKVRYTLSGFMGALPGVVGAAIVSDGVFWKKDLKEKYQFEKVNVAA